jgi:thiocyanate desulfurase
MSQAGKRTTVKDEFIPPQINLEQEQSKGALATKQQIEAYLQRKAEVTQHDHQAFQDYLSQKEQTTSAPKDESQQPSKFNRRNLLKVVAGTAVAGEAAAATYSWVTGGSVSDPGAKLAGSRYAEAQRQNIERTLIDSKADVGGRGLGKWVLLLPTKLGGGTYALDLNTNRVLASIWYWTYGDYNPISHHLCAFPSADPYHSFEFVNSTQGGKKGLIYGITPEWRRLIRGSTSIGCATTARKWS